LLYTIIFVKKNYYGQQILLFSHLQKTGSFKQDGHMIAPHPTQVLSDLLHPQCLHFSFFISHII